MHVARLDEGATSTLHGCSIRRTLDLEFDPITRHVSESGFGGRVEGVVLHAVPCGTDTGW